MDLTAILRAWGTILDELHDNDFGDPETINVELSKDGRAVNICGVTTRGWEYNYSSITKKFTVFTDFKIEG